MRNTLLFFLLLASGSLFAQSNIAPWVQQNSGTLASLNEVHFTSPVVGYVVGDSGTALKTTDGGANWTQMTGLPTIELLSVAFADPDTGYILPGFGSMYITHDAGNTWFEDTLQFQNYCYWNKVRVSPDGLLYLLYKGCFGDNHVITLNTSTGDTTDYFIYGDFDYGEEVRDIDFPSPGTAVAVGDSGMLVRTTDGGDNWTALADADTSADFKAIDFVDADTGYAMTHDLFLPLWITVDGGQSWARDSSWAATFFYPTFNDIEYMPGKNGYLVGSTQGGGIAFRYDYWGGAWTFPPNLNAVDLVMDTLAWAVGDSGYIVRIGDPLLSVEEVVSEVEELVIYPNPASDLLSIRWPEGLVGHATVELYDLQGRKAESETVYPDRSDMDISELPAGVYVVRLLHEDSVWTGKMLKRH